MEYLLIPILVVGMLGYMFWRVVAHLRRDRVLNEREQTRGRHAFTPKHRLRFLLGRAFRPPPEDEPQWQAELKSSLDRVPKTPEEQAGR
ncbi:MAG TPA: hypothetical protein VGD10_09060 [Allosphingosinicella sp.]|uniref:hypothetical protein n=1 Tax=Allosphingosinicella sp. TaxID=2823234 RepID=UPI002ED92A02